MSGIYADLAEYYDVVYSFKDYRTETARVVELACRYGRSAGRDWLDVACGTAQHLQHLPRRYRRTGVDLSAAMLRVARRRLPEARFVRGDLRRFHLGHQYDVVTCLFSSIGYVQTMDGLRQGITNLARHLKPGGVLLIEPWLTPQGFRPGTVHLRLEGSGEVRIARANSSERRGRLSILRMHYLIAEPGRPIRYAVDAHSMGLFTTSETLRLLRGAGLRARFLRKGLTGERGLFVAVKPAASLARRARLRPRT
ncbi:MAG TPA: class I SAM-dependent methyltransferase [Thermoplasmata archaeon]|nr:class I SAM-dependent methyltransferase [Thermoplasmata archaeon]